MTIAAVSGVSGREAGLASGLINTSQQVGGALGLAILASVANSRTDDVMAAAGGASRRCPTALTEGFQDAFMVGAGLRHRRRDPRRRADLQQGQPRARRGGAPRRGGGRPGRRPSRRRNAAHHTQATASACSGSRSHRSASGTARKRSALTAMFTLAGKTATSSAISHQPPHGAERRSSSASAPAISATPLT